MWMRLKNGRREFFTTKPAKWCKQGIDLLTQQWQQRLVYDEKTF